ncbi:MAG: isoprenylcysteine carboxylmethyltransferase family protein [Calditrichaeota bacterium]|nr:MAG: isoprenylcysteine carboxylmethyltransferase family protein [Calditrichota bacterium]
MREMFSGGTLTSYILIFCQFLFLGCFLFTGPVLAHHPLFLLIEFSGLFLGLWAIIVMYPKGFKVIPEVSPKATLNTRGPYRFIRHPMYTSLLMFTGALLLDYPTWLRGILWLALFITLIFKIRYEETLLQKKFPHYTEYAQRSKRLFPGIW